MMNRIIYRGHSIYYYAFNGAIYFTANSVYPAFEFKGWYNLYIKHPKDFVKNPLSVSWQSLLKFTKWLSKHAQVKWMDRYNDLIEFLQKNVITPFPADDIAKVDTDLVSPDTQTNLNVVKVNGQSMVTSLTVAETFDVDHNTVMTYINNIVDDIEINEVTHVPNSVKFAASVYIDGTHGYQQKPMYFLSKDAMLLLIGNFTSITAKMDLLNMFEEKN